MLGLYANIQFAIAAMLALVGTNATQGPRWLSRPSHRRVVRQSCDTDPS